MGFSIPEKAILSRISWTSKWQAGHILQEIWLAAFRRRSEKGWEPQKEQAYLFHIAKARAVDRIRRAQRSRRYFGTRVAEDVLDSVPDENASIESIVASTQADEHLWKAIRELPPQRQYVMFLRVHGRESYEEIARKLGIRTRTVKEHVTEAKKTLHARFNRLTKDRRTS